MKFDAEVIMDNSKGTSHLKAGLFAEVTIPVKATETILIDKTALVGSRQNPSVFVIEGGRAIKRTIVTSESDDKYIEVISGLKKGEQVVTSGQLNLHNGNKVSIIQ